MTQQPATFVSSAILPHGQQVSSGAAPPRRLSERIWQSTTTLRGRFILFASIITLFAILTAGTILVSSIRANDDLNTMNAPSVNAAQAIIPYIENVDAQATIYLANTDPNDIHPCVISAIDPQQPDQRSGNLSIHECADRTIDADLRTINHELFLAGHNVSFAGERTAIEQTETGLEEYLADIALMRSEFKLSSNPSSPSDHHMQNAYQYAIAATNVLHQQIIPLAAGTAGTESGVPSCTLNNQQLSPQKWPNGGIEQNVECLSAISKANLDTAYQDTVKFVGISLGLVFGLCIYSCLFLAWAAWSMASTTHRLLNIGLSIAFIVALLFTVTALSDFDAIYGYKGNFSVIQSDYGTVYNTGVLEQQSADANADLAHWLLALKFNDPNANHWYNDWQAKNQAVQSSIQAISAATRSAQTQQLYTGVKQDWNRENGQSGQVVEMVRNATGTTNAQNLPGAENMYTNDVNASFQAFLQDANRFSTSYNQEYNAVFRNTGTLLTSLMTWCSAAFLVLGLLAVWGITRRLKDF